MQPRITQVPPMRYSSASATRAPAIAAMREARTPPEPPPMTNRSKSNFIFEPLRPSHRKRCYGHLPFQALRAEGEDGHDQDAPSLSRYHFHFAGGGDQKRGSHPHEQSMLDHARHGVKCGTQFGGVLDRPQMAVIDHVAVVGRERLVLGQAQAQLWLDMPQSFQRRDDAL